MSEFREKSAQNIKAASFLANEKQLFAASVNRSYYACIQDLLHVIHYKLKEDKGLFEAKRRQLGTGTHQHAINVISTALMKKDRKDWKWYQQKMPAFKLLREKADYSENQITLDESLSCIADCNAILRVINDHIK